MGYGALGALVSLVVVQVVPYGLRLMNGAQFTMTVGRLVGFFLVLGGFALAGAVVALLFGSDATRAKEPIAYGLGWQGLIGGLLQGVRAEKNGGDRGDADADEPQ
jgi:hypothetical protein